MTFRFLVLSVLAASLTACASAPPDWIAAPAVEQGFAATACVADSGNLSRDRQATVSQARAELARQIAARIEAMDRTYAALAKGDPPAADADADADAEAAPPQTFAGAAPAVVEEALTALQPARVEYVEVDDVEQVCALMALEAAPARAVFDRIVEASRQPLDDPARAALYRAFAGSP